MALERMGKPPMTYRTNQEKAEWPLAHGVSLPDSGDAPRAEQQEKTI